MKSKVEVNKKQKVLDQFELAINVLRDQFKELLEERDELKVHEAVLLSAYESASLERNEHKALNEDLLAILDCEMESFCDELELRSEK
jgi:hypothetical protein